MSGHCPQCGLYHEEDDARRCSACAATSQHTGPAVPGNQQESIMVQKPSVGRIVHYVPPEGVTDLRKHDQPYPAVITHVWGDTCVNLHVIADGSFPLSQGGYEHPVHMPTSVNQSSDPDKPVPGTWQWPPRV